MTVTQIRRHRWGWRAFEAHGVKPVFPKKDRAIDYGQNRACFRSGQILVLDSTGKLACAITDRSLSVGPQSAGQFPFAVVAMVDFSSAIVASCFAAVDFSCCTVWCSLRNSPISFLGHCDATISGYLVDVP
jgi:hypothetical protein